MPNMRRWEYHHGGQAAQEWVRDQINPNGNYWHSMADEAATEFIALRGRPAYEEWVDATLPDTSFSWKFLHDQIRAELAGEHKGAQIAASLGIPVDADGVVEVSLSSSYPKNTTETQNCQNLMEPK